MIINAVSEIRVVVRATSGIALVAIGMFLSLSPCRAADVTAGSQSPAGCSAVTKEGRLELRSPWFAYSLDMEAALTAQWLENRRTGHRISLDGSTELELDVDAAQQRISITGWKFAGSGGDGLPPDKTWELLKATHERSMTTRNGRVS